jgi:hypothetical protein
MGALVGQLVSLCTSLRVATSTRLTYSRHHHIFLEYCDAFGVHPLHLTEPELMGVVLHFALSHTVNSVGSYVSAIQFLWDDAGNGKLPRGQPFELFLRGLKRLLGAADEVVRTPAVSLDDISAIVASLHWDSPDDVSFGAELLTAFFLALRTEDHVDGRLRWGDVYPQHDGSTEFLLPPGKSVRTYRHVAVAVRPDFLNLQRWLQRLASFLPPARRKSSCPVFVSFARAGSGSFPAITRADFTRRFKAKVTTVLGRSSQLHAGYSLRRGGVTEMLSAGVPVAIVKRHVGWAPSSEAINFYYDHSGRVQLRIPTLALPLFPSR